MISIIDYIPKDGRIKTRDLATILNMDAREVRHAVQAVRLQGVPILADKDGLYYSEDPDEVESYCDRLAMVIRSLDDVKKSIRDVIY